MKKIFIVTALSFITCLSGCDVENPATKQELIEVIEANPCAYEPISRFVEQRPISLFRANYLAIKCKREILRKTDKDEQKEALKHFMKNEQ